ncbi:MAG: hypothetical protein RSG77_09915 [Hafnia sp.]
MLIKSLLSLFVIDMAIKARIRFSEIIDGLTPAEADILKLWFAYHHTHINDLAESLCSKNNHAAFLLSQRGIGVITQFRMLQWSAKMQKALAQKVFAKNVIEVANPTDRIISPSRADQADQAREISATPLAAFVEDGELQILDIASDFSIKERVAFRPININNSYHKGFMYYPTQTIRQETELVGGRYRINEWTENVVIRSDRAVLTIEESYKPSHVTGGKILRLSDGTLIQRRPSSNGHNTWEWESIQSFLKNGDKARHLNDMLSEIKSHLYARVWLPDEEDYWLLSLAVVVTYTQSIFDSVPLFLLTGPAGSGKSELSGAMAEVSANSVMIGQTSAPTMMRLIDESGGLVIIDDLEAVGVSSNGNQKENVSDIAQALKVSYKKSSATRLVTNTRTMQTEILNFYGVKIISNTRSVDAILGSRMLHINTRHMPEDMMPLFKQREKSNLDDIKQLRNSMHIWTFENVGLIRNKYTEMYSDKTNRDDEIAAPLRVIASLTGDESIQAALERSLQMQSSKKFEPDSPDELVREAVEGLILSGYRTLSISHLMLEMKKMADTNLGKDFEGEIPVWSKPEWIGRHLRSNGFIDIKKGPERKRVKSSNLRFVSLSTEHIQSVLRKNKRSFVSVKKADDFCKDCKSCPYADLGCEIMAAMKVV